MSNFGWAETEEGTIVGHPEANCVAELRPVLDERGQQVCCDDRESPSFGDPQWAWDISGTDPDLSDTWREEGVAWGKMAARNAAELAFQRQRRWR